MMTMDNLADMFSALQGLLFEQVLQPVMFATGLGHLLPDGFNAMGWLLVGLLQLLVMVTVGLVVLSLSAKLLDAAPVLPTVSV